MCVCVCVCVCALHSLLVQKKKKKKNAGGQRERERERAPELSSPHRWAASQHDAGGNKTPVGVKSYLPALFLRALWAAGGAVD